MKTTIKRFDKSLPLPAYQTKGAAAFDLHAREKTKIAPLSGGYVPLNIALKPPKDCFVLLSARSSTHKRGLMLANGIGIVDSDYCGDNDEYITALFNFTKKPVIVKKGDRVVQAMFIKFVKANWQEVLKIKSKTRGGFGSTGKKLN